MADVVHTRLVLATARAEGRRERALAGMARNLLVRRLLARYGRAELARLLPEVAERWMTDRNVSDAERAATLRLVRDQAGS